jgi:beta-lactam-binding protein with PASTA domain
MKKAERNNLKAIVNDSIWTNQHRSGIILRQSPDALSRVKKKRTIYLTITKAKADEKTLPSLVGSDNYDYYKRRLKQMGITLKIRDKKFQNKLEENTILYL